MSDPLNEVHGDACIMCTAGWGRCGDRKVAIEALTYVNTHHQPHWTTTAILFREVLGLLLPASRQEGPPQLRAMEIM